MRRKLATMARRKSAAAMATRQRIVRSRREYNQWVANQTLEDYALRFTAKSARKWSAARVANTALGAISFLALEAIGGDDHPELRRSPTPSRPSWSSALMIFACGAADRYYAARGRRRHRSAHPRRRLRLYRIDDHVAHLRHVHLHLLRHRGRDPRRRRCNRASASRSASATSSARSASCRW